MLLSAGLLCYGVIRSHLAVQEAAQWILSACTPYIAAGCQMGSVGKFAG